jgi:hypothetical protein
MLVLRSISDLSSHRPWPQNTKARNECSSSRSRLDTASKANAWHALKLDLHSSSLRKCCLSSKEVPPDLLFSCRVFVAFAIWISRVKKGSSRNSGFVLSCPLHFDEAGCRETFTGVDVD